VYDYHKPTLPALLSWKEQANAPQITLNADSRAELDEFASVIDEPNGM